nr:VWA domain-containing protein [Legionella jordanis]
MMTEFHLLRPWWLLAFLPVFCLIWMLWRKPSQIEAWAAICDHHLLNKLLQSRGKNKKLGTLMLLLLCASFMIIALSGPSWSRLPVPVYKQIQPRVLVLDMSDSMLAKDLAPDRLTRAKFKLHDILNNNHPGQFALLVYTGEPFIVAPLTDDAKTIDSLISTLTPDIMPVEGNRLDLALEQASQLISQAGFNHGQILVLTAERPNDESLALAKKLAQKQIYTSVMPIRASDDAEPLFQTLATAGAGKLINFNDDKQLAKWLSLTKSNNDYHRSQQDNVSLWRDEGRWFILPALLFLFPLFRRGWLQRLSA